ncbi:MAG: caspase family protein [Holophagales bacterium]|nr:MAG: caspase family protein [Holophagales bacterium]
MSGSRLLAALAAAALAWPTAVRAFTVHSPVGVVGDHAAATAAVTRSLGARFHDLRRFASLAAAQDAARGEGGPEVGLVVSATEQPHEITAYGVGMATCDVSLTVEVFALPAGRALFSHASPHRGPSCAEALAAAVDGLADELLVKLESYRRAGPASAEPEIRVELVPAAGPEGQRAVAEQLRRVIGVRRVRPLPDGGLVLTVYRELRELARAIDALPDLAVSRLGDGELTLRTAAGESTGSSREASRSDIEGDTPRRDLAPPPSPVAVAEARATSYPSSRESVPASPAAGLSAVAPAGPFHDKWALVVGISRYADATVPTLGYARKDAETFASTLRDAAIGRFLPDRVITLLDDQATLRNVKSQIELLARVVTEDDLFVVFLSTHAAPGEVDLAGDPYFVAYDTEKSDLYATGLAMRELTDALLHRIRARHVVAFLDACYTGQVLARSQLALTGAKSMVFEPAAGAPAPVSWAREWDSLARGSRDPAVPAPPRAATPSDKSIVLMTSSDGTEPSWESDSLGHGVFTYYLVEGLRESRGLATVGELFDRLRTRVAQQVAAEKQRQQQPRLFYSDPPRVAIGAPAVSGRGGSNP